MQNPITEFLQQRIDANDFPSAVYLVAEKGEIILHGALGHAVMEPERIEARTDTIYDLASLTKVLVTGLLLAELVETRDVELDSRVSTFLKQFDTDEKRMITVADLLAHRSRMPAWKPFYLECRDPREILENIANTPLDHGQESVTYSDLNFIVLAALVERVKAERLDVLFREVISQIGLHDTGFSPSRSVLQRIAASEHGNEFERQTCIEKGYIEPTASGTSELSKPSDGPALEKYFRQGVIWGEVHDGNAFFMDGVSGHAGLFSTAADVFRLALEFLPNSTTLLKPETCALFYTNLTRGLSQDRSFAFQLASTKDSTAGTKLPPKSFGHLGFTGTSLWIDPIKERILVLLTNRTHHHELPFVNINSVRRSFHDISIDFLDKNL